jgi:hypothetical protein
LTVTKTSGSSNFYKAVDTKNHSSVKYLLKALIRSLGPNEPDQQRRFGFSFVWQKPQLEDNIPRQYDDAKFAIAPDSLVKEALMTWITFLNEGEEGLVVIIRRKKKYGAEADPFFKKKIAKFTKSRQHFKGWKKIIRCIRFSFILDVSKKRERVDL